jgi:hypothetical protein
MDHPTPIEGKDDLFVIASDSAPLGSLAQSARARSLGAATLIFALIAAFFLFIGVVLVLGRAKAVEDFRAKALKGLGFWDVTKRLEAFVEIDRFEKGYRIATIIMFSIGGPFVGFAILMRWFPVASTLLGLTLFISLTSFLAYSLVVSDTRPGLIHIVPVVMILLGLLKALRAAIAYQAERKLAKVAKVEPVKLPPAVFAPPAETPGRPARPRLAYVPVGEIPFAVARTPWAAVVAAAAVVGCIGVGIKNKEEGPVIAAILPAAIAVALWAVAEPSIEGQVSAEGVELFRPRGLIPFDAIQKIDAEVPPFGPPPPSYRIKVYHHQGLLTIPAGPGVDSRAIHAAILSRLEPGGSRQVHPALADYLGRNLAVFGPDRVWSYRATSHGGESKSGRVIRALGLATLATGFAWMVISSTAGGAVATTWAQLGAALFGWSILVLAVSWAISTRLGRLARIKEWRASSLVISPVGLAMVQGKIRGELAWDQIHDVRLGSRGQGITLTVEGAQIVIVDLYDRPIELIHERILRYWNPGRLAHPVQI